ncbi:MAG TPA: oligopeptide/dipeptide ABC transporter ATP-binding protein [Stellaceae bacterium]|nr:oligopeptide/dipeptide ABC transporter ATP-binding protein [Stellaceae bacterium]
MSAYTDGGEGAGEGAGAGGAKGEPILSVRHLVKEFPIRSRGLLPRVVGAVHAVSDISFDLYRGETLGLVGESGCGKTTTSRAVLHLQPATSGQVFFEGRELTALGRSRMRVLRRDLQLVFQDPYASLNPRITVNQIIAEPLKIHGLFRDGGQRTVSELMQRVGLNPEHGVRYPHEFSGGQRQRIGIARALALNPRFIVCDEPVSALDVSIQAQIVNLLQDLQDEMGLAYLFIAHDLGVVKHISDRVAVMYLGKIVEIAEKRSLYAEPLHPYTQALIAAVPEAKPRAGRRKPAITGEIPSALNPPTGCRFHTRCPHVMPVCREIEPAVAEPKPGHRVACHLYPVSAAAAPTAATA